MSAELLVLKIGTSSLTRGDGKLALGAIAALVEAIADLQAQGQRVVLVSSGAVGVGCARLGMAHRPQTIALKQAAAAVGQGRLMGVYDDLFSHYGLTVAQLLLTRSDLEKRQSYKNIHNTLRSLLALGVIPIINENDTVAIEELKFGDNDTLSARVASVIEADWLFLLTDVDRLYSADPRQDPTAQPIATVEDVDDLVADVGGQGSAWGTGGMVTKMAAARIATRAGIKTVITNGSRPSDLAKILAGEEIGTLFKPHKTIDSARKRWLAHGTIPVGQLVLDRGAVQAIRERGKSLLPAGVLRVQGEFAEAATVQLWDEEEREIAIGSVNYNSDDLRRIAGHQSGAIAQILGYSGEQTVVHRDNLVLTGKQEFVG